MVGAQGGLLRAEGADTEEVFVARKVDFDFNGFAVVGERRGKIGGGLQLQINHGVAVGFFNMTPPRLRSVMVVVFGV